MQFQQIKGETTSSKDDSNLKPPTIECLEDDFAIVTLLPEPDADHS